MHGGSPAKFPTKSSGEYKWTISAQKQIKNCAEYLDMLPRPRLELSGTTGLRPIGFPLLAYIPCIWLP